MIVYVLLQIIQYNVNSLFHLHNIFPDVSGNCSDSASRTIPTRVIPSVVLTTSSASVEENNNQSLQPSAIIPSVKLKYSTPEPSLVTTSSFTRITSETDSSIDPTSTSDEENSPQDLNENTLWKCNVTSLNENEENYSFPNIGETDLHPSLWQDSEPGVSYVYRVVPDQIGCSGGLVTDLHFCYRVLHQNLSNAHIFTLHVVNINGSNTSMPVYSTPVYNSSRSSSGYTMCMRHEENKYCCSSRNLSSENATIIFPSLNFTLIVTTVNSSCTLLQNFKKSTSEQSQYSYNSERPDMWNAFDHFKPVVTSNFSLQAIRLNISKCFNFRSKIFIRPKYFDE